MTSTKNTTTAQGPTGLLPEVSPCLSIELPPDTKFHYVSFDSPLAALTGAILKETGSSGKNRVAALMEFQDASKVDTVLSPRKKKRGNYDNGDNEKVVFDLQEYNLMLCEPGTVHPEGRMLRDLIGTFLTTTGEATGKVMVIVTVDLDKLPEVSLHDDDDDISASESLAIDFAKQLVHDHSQSTIRVAEQYVDRAMIGPDGAPAEAADGPSTSRLESLWKWMDAPPSTIDDNADLYTVMIDLIKLVCRRLSKLFGPGPSDERAQVVPIRILGVRHDPQNLQNDAYWGAVLLVLVTVLVKHFKA